MGVGNSKKMAKSGHVSPIKGRPVLNPQRVVFRKRYVRTLDAHPKSQKHAQGIVRDRAAMVHTVVFDTEPQQSIIGILLSTMIHE